MNQNYTPVILQILNKDNNLMAEGVCEYDELDGITARLQELCKVRSLYLKTSVPHTLTSLLHWLER